VEDELVMYRILDVRLRRTFGDKVFGVGTVTIFTADETNKELKLEKIESSKKVRDMLSEIAESERAKIGIKGRELYGVAENVFERDHNNN
jgi:membrane protein YdbS with pleckstrin-like domain